MSETYLTISVITATTSGISAWIAIKAYRIAEQTRKAAARIEKADAIRRVTDSQEELQAEISRIDSLATKLKSAYQTLFHFAGGHNHSAKAELLAKLKQQTEAAHQCATCLQNIPEHGNKLHNTSIFDLEEYLIAIQNNRSKARLIREEMERDLNNTQDQITPYRNRANATPKML